MEIKIHRVNEVKIAELISDQIIIDATAAGLAVIGDLYYQDFDKVIIHSKNIATDFFDLKTQLAGEVLQKCSNFHLRLVIIFEAETAAKESLVRFIQESNRGRQVNFLPTVDDALMALSN